ncbi:gamma-D-glutamyl-meso-diaminopimelate peptidase [Paenibacillus psychroresistens]|uniref:Gamma-D-glutamyl-meso-diaminopimelate peptidase n=1 Tax=Paenibacillus psychroresistens TaxID=1778678 RepID=A0A6B8RHF6_9BACL|nr:M14 family metallocarboxypeptidase [Paenibacillus psychroresistens]QGQ95650.1 gamma-D-glutamyl-meso-diaminopimelate peptidase [Paenibacillus psychroresistens]
MYKKLVLVILCLSFILLNLHEESSAETSNIINPNQVYTYEIMTKDIVRLAAAYPDLITYKSIGTTLYGRQIWAVKLGKGTPAVFINASHHAREWLTTTLTMNMIDQYAQAFVNKKKILEFNVQELLNKTSIWFVPMVNPDGVTLQQKGAKAFPTNIRAKLIQMNGGSDDFSKWKANAEGIDPNRQYDADWEHITAISYRPNWKNYKGIAPVQTAEAKTLVNFTKEIKPEIALAYHSAGEILYWNFHTKAENLNRDKKMALTLTYLTGYSLVPDVASPSGGGYTDWFIQEFNKPGFTAEIGRKLGEDELPLSSFGGIWGQNKAVGLYLANEGYKLWKAKNPVTKVALNVTTFENTPLYNDVTGVTYKSMEPQKVMAFEKSGEHWFHIHTSTGDHWIYSKKVIVGETDTISEDIILNEYTNMYDIPFKDDSASAGIITPQVVHKIEQWNDWYKIETWLGDKWIQIKKED